MNFAKKCRSIAALVAAMLLALCLAGCGSETTADAAASEDYSAYLANEYMEAEDYAPARWFTNDDFFDMEFDKDGTVILDKDGASERVGTWEATDANTFALTFETDSAETQTCTVTMETRYRMMMTFDNDATQYMEYSKDVK